MPSPAEIESWKRIRDAQLEAVQSMVIAIQDIDMPRDSRELIAFALYPVAKNNGWWRGAGTFLHDIGFENGEIAELLTSHRIKDKWWIEKFNSGTLDP